MESVKLKTHVGQDGLLQIQLPTEISSPKQVRTHCSSGRSTKWHRCDCPTSWKTIGFFALTAKLSDVRCS